MLICRICRGVIILIALAAAVSNSIAAELSVDNSITVYTDQEAGKVNRRILGTNFLGLDPIKKQWPPYYYKRADYGTGIWNPAKNRSVSEVIKLAKEAGISIIRYATGNHFNWKDAIGTKRKRFLYGIDEFLETVQEIGAEADFIISYFSGNEQDAADLVEYLNAVNNSDHPWAQKRAENGHPESYGIQYFEFGNEIFVFNKRDNKQVKPEEYAARYVVYQRAMKNIDSSIKLGLVLHHYDWRWDYKVLETVGDNVDFVVRHIYPPKDLAYYTSAEDYKSDELFKVILGSLSFYTEKQFDATQRIIKEMTGKDDILYAITEYNIGLHHKPQYKFSMGAALVNAELIRIFMNPENNVLMANCWNFIEEYFGIVKIEGGYTKDVDTRNVRYVERPSYHVYELYNKHFGDVLLKTDVKGDAFDISTYKPYMRAHINNMSNRTLIGYEWLNNRLINRIKRTVMRALDEITGDQEVLGANALGDKWEIKTMRGVDTEINDQVLMIEFKNPDKYNYFHSIKRAPVEPDTYYKLSGFIKTENLIDHKGVSLEVEDGRGWNETHSAAHTDEIKGSVDWQYVEVVYKTLSDAELVKVRARRADNKGPLKGRAYFKDVKLQKFVPPDTLVPYLTVNASKSRRGDKIYLIVINKHMKEPISTVIDLKIDLSSNNRLRSKDDVWSDKIKAHSWILNGDSVYLTNEDEEDSVRVKSRTIEIDSLPLEYTFMPHSITAIEILQN